MSEDAQKVKVLSIDHSAQFVNKPFFFVYAELWARVLGQNAYFTQTLLMRAALKEFDRTECANANNVALTMELGKATSESRKATYSWIKYSESTEHLIRSWSGIGQSL